MVDLDQSGHGFQRIRTYLGPSLGWTDEIVQPISTVTTAGVYAIKPGDSMILVNVAGLVTIQLPDVRQWVQQDANQPATGFERSITVKDMGGNAQNFNISITPFSTQTIDGIAAPVVIVINRASTRLYPLADMTGWVVESTAVGGPGANGDVFKAGNNTFTGTNIFQGQTIVPSMSLDDNSTNVANTFFVKAQGYISAVDLTAYAKLNSPAFIGTPTAPTPMPLNSDGSLATTFFVWRGFQPLDGDLTALAALSGINTIYYRSAANVWSPVVVAAPLTFTGGVLGTSAGGGNVNSVPTPTNGQIARWTGPTTIEGVDSASLGFQPLDADLTAIAAITATNSLIYRVSADTWGPVTIGSGMTFASGILSATNTTQGNVNSTGGGYAVTTLTGYADATGNLIRAITVGTGLNLTGSALTCTVSTAGLATIDSPTFTGDPKAPTPATSDNDTSIATTAFVKAQGYTTAAIVAAGFQPLDADLTSLAAATSTNQWYYRSAAGQWDPVTVGAGLTFTSGILTAAGGGGNVSSVGTPAATQVAQWTSASQIQGVPLTTWRTGAAFTGSTTFRDTAGGDGLNINGAANQGQIVAAGANADIGLVLTSKGNTGITFYNASFTRFAASFLTAPGSNTFVTFTGNVGSSSIANNPAGNPLIFGSTVDLPTGSVAVTQSPGDNSTKIATTAFVAASSGGGGFSTGDVKYTMKTVADTGWVMMDDGSIGNTGSGSTTRANADAQPLFALIYANTTDANCPLQTSTGAATTRAAQGTAAAAFAANCRLLLPPTRGRAVAGAGNGSGLTARPLGSTGGLEFVTLGTGEIPSHTHANSISNGNHYHLHGGNGVNQQASYFSVDGGGTYNASQWGSYFANTQYNSASGMQIDITNAAAGGGAGHANIQPTTWLNLMIKL